MAEPPYRRVHIVVNPASGKDEPILNVLNDVFAAHGVDWDVTVTHRYGDAKAQARRAIDDGVDLVAGYGGDGTQHEIANAVVTAARDGGRDVVMGVLPGGTGNGFARELGVPRTLRPAVEVLCTSRRTRAIDVGLLREVAGNETGDRYFIQRVYVGMEPEEQTSRELKDKYGVFAYAVSLATRGPAPAHVYHVEIDGETGTVGGTRAYLVNSGMMGTGLRITHTYSVEDGLLDCFLVDARDFDTLKAAAERLAALPVAGAARHFRQGRSVRLVAEPDQAVWADGEHVGRTPLAVDVLPGALRVAVP